MKTVITNRFDIRINYENIYMEFEVYEKNIPILHKNIASKKDKELGNKEIYAFAHEFIEKTSFDSYFIWVNNANKASIICLIKKQRLGEIPLHELDLKKLERKTFENIPKNEVLNLLIKTITQDELLFSTYTTYDLNKVYYVVEEAGEILKTLEMYFNKHNLLIIKAVAFKLLSETSDIKKIHKPLFKIFNEKLVNIKNEEWENNEKKLYIKGNKKNEKIHISYLTAYDLKVYKKSKSYFAGKLLASIHRYLVLENLLELEQRSMEMETKIAHSEYRNNKKNKELLHRAEQKIPYLNIINTTDCQTQALLELIQNEFENIPLYVKKTAEKDAYNLLFTYEKKLYGALDPYIKNKEIDPYSQSSEIKKRKNSTYVLPSKHIIRVCIKELLIKHDIKHQKCTLANDNAIKSIFIKEIIKTKHTTVAKEDNQEKQIIFHALTFNENQEMLYQKLDAHNSDKFSILKTLSEVKSNIPLNFISCEAIIEDFKGNFCALMNTDLYASLDYLKVFRYIQSYQMMSKEEQEKSGRWNLINGGKDEGKFCYIESIRYVKTFKISETPLKGYIVGKHKGLHSNSYATNDPAKILIPADFLPNQEEIDMEKIIQSLDYYFVRNRNITAYPYQLKYLREHINLQQFLDYSK